MYNELKLSNRRFLPPAWACQCDQNHGTQDLVPHTLLPEPTSQNNHRRR